MYPKEKDTQGQTCSWEEISNRIYTILSKSNYINQMKKSIVNPGAEADSDHSYVQM